MALLNKKKQLLKKDATEVTDLQEPNFMLVLMNRYIKWVILLVIIGVLILSYALVLADKIDEVNNSATESIPAKEKVLSDLRAIKADLDQVVIDFDSIKSSKRDVLDQLDRLLPNKPEFAGLFTMVDDITTRSGMKLSSISIAESSGLIDTTANFQEYDAFDFSKVAKNVSSMSISISVSGGDYTTFKNYLDTLERNIRIFDVQSVAVDGGTYRAQEEQQLNPPEPGEEVDLIEGRYSIELITYYHTDS